MITKALFIIKILYLECFFLLLFYNIISLFVYIDNIFYIIEMDKKSEKNKYYYIINNIKKMKFILNNQ